MRNGPFDPHVRYRGPRVRTGDHKGSRARSRGRWHSGLMSDPTNSPAQILEERLRLSGGFCSEVARCTDYRDRRAQRYRPSCCSAVLTAALALSGHPLDGHHIGRVESVPSVVTQGLAQPVRTYPHSGQRVLVIIEGPATAQTPEQQPDL